MFSAISIAIWALGSKFNTFPNLPKRELLILFLTNIGILLFFAGEQLFCTLGICIFFIFLHSFLVLENASNLNSQGYEGTTAGQSTSFEGKGTVIGESDRDTNESSKIDTTLDGLTPMDCDI